MHPTRRTAAATIAGAVPLLVPLLVPASALAHPSLSPSTTPPDREITATLVVPHGCGADGAGSDRGEASPTTEIAVEVPAGVESVAPTGKDGWELSVEEEDGSVTSWGWTAAGGGTADVLEFQVTLTPGGEAGDTIYFPVFQGCEGGSLRWIGTPDREAELPAMTLTLGEAAADGTAGGTDHEPRDGDAGDGHADHDGGSRGAGSGGAAGRERTPEPGSDAAEGTGAEPGSDAGDVGGAEPGSDAAEGTGAEPAGAATGDVGSAPWMVAAAAALALGAGAAVLARRRVRS